MTFFLLKNYNNSRNVRAGIPYNYRREMIWLNKNVLYKGKMMFYMNYDYVMIKEIKKTRNCYFTNKKQQKKEEKFWKEYRRLRNKVTSENRKLKKKYYFDKLCECQNRGQSWKVLKSITTNKSSSSTIPISSNDTLSVANKFNFHFANVANDLINGFDANLNDVVYSSDVDNVFVLHTVQEKDILKEILNLKNKKSVGVDDISTFILKTCANELIGSITYLINKSILDGKVPALWKIAKIIPLHKKGDKSNPDNYRPISLLPCISKILEKIIQIQLTKFLDVNKILVKEQSGFRARHSTTTALMRVTDDWLKAMDNGQYTGAVFIDLQKAFDMVNHELLLLKLSGLGIAGKSLEWFASYLSNRKIITFLNNTLSEEYSINNGVPQGSLIGPILFAIFINDLASLFDKCSFHLYADDTVLYYSDKDPQVVETVLNEELNKVIKWMDKNKLKLNCTKTVGMLLGTRHMLIKHSNLNFKINDVNITNVDSVKYLGVIIDRELKWNIL